MKIVSFAVLLLTLGLAACSAEDQSLEEAISESSKAVSAFEKSQNPELTESERAELQAEFSAHSEAAILLYQQLIEQEPDNGLYHNNLGWLYLKLGKADEAKASLQLAQQFESSIFPEGALEKNLQELAELDEASNN